MLTGTALQSQAEKHDLEGRISPRHVRGGSENRYYHVSL